MSDFFSKDKQEWLDARSSSLRGYYLGEPISKNKHSDVYYRNALDKELDKFIVSMLQEINRVYAVLPITKADYVIKSQNEKPTPAKVRKVIENYKKAKSAILFKNCQKIINKWLKLATKSAQKSIQKMLTNAAGKSIKINYNKAYDELFKMIIARNVQLIKNTTSQTLTNIENIVYNGMTTGRGWGDIEPDLYHQKHISQDRVKRIARDQTSKANGALNQISQQKAGIEYYMWWGVEDERERELHWKLNGKIFKWEDSPERMPIIDKNGERGGPASAVNCRCVGRMVILLEGYITRWLGDNKGYEIIKER